MNSFSSAMNSAQVFLETYKLLNRSENYQGDLNDLKIEWARDFLHQLNVNLEVIGTPSSQPSTLFIGNHISYIDIGLILRTVRGVSFVAKKEVSRWPIIGRGARQLDTVFVNRGAKSSRGQAKLDIQEALERGKRILVFPSGTTCIKGEKPWKKGSFEVAQNAGAMIQPFRLTYDPLRTAAYIDKDILPVHMYQLFKHGQINAKLEFHEPVRVTDPTVDCQRWKEWATSMGPEDSDSLAAG